MAARAILTCRPNSHPFQDRGVSLDQPVKIGRSVARARPNVSNAIFDCKVLSRNHALLWYETGKFYLQDTKSSNGTFVNNQRLSKSSEESTPREVCSGDIVQFGVDVMELNKKVTHGCIVATLQLFLPDGKEAKAGILSEWEEERRVLQESFEKNCQELWKELVFSQSEIMSQESDQSTLNSSTALPDKVPATSVQEIYQLNQYLKEAMQREQMIENKLATINKFMASTKDSVDSNWKVLIEEDRLLTRVDILERQLQASHKTMTDDKLREEVLQLHADKEKYQIVAKEALRKAAQERMEALKSLQDIQRNLSNSEEEKMVLQERFDKNCQELKELVDKYEQSEIKSKELDQSTLKYKEELEILNNKIKEGEALLQEQQQQIDSLIAKLETEDSQKKEQVTDKEDLKNVSLSGLSEFNKIINDRDSMSKGDVEYPDGNMNLNVHWDNSEIETLKNQIKSADTERKEILNKLSHLLNLIEDLKAVSNKFQLSFIQDIVHKLEIEIRQIRNCSQGDEPLRNNSYNISEEEDPSETKMENNMDDHRNSEGIEKLLEESRSITKALQNDNLALKKEKEHLQEQLAEFALQLKTYQERAQSLCKENLELEAARVEFQSRVELLQSQASSSEKDSREIRQHLETIKQLKEEISSLESMSKERDETIARLMIQIGDLSSKQDVSSSVIDVACQTIQNLTAAEPDFSSEITLKSKIILSEEDNQSLPDMTEKLLKFEEELAVYKTEYSVSSSENATLRRKLEELQSQHKAIHNQSKLIFFCLSFPLTMLILAVVVAFYPSLD